MNLPDQVESVCTRSSDRIDLEANLCAHMQLPSSPTTIQLSSFLVCWSRSLTCLGSLTRFCSGYPPQALFRTTQQKVIVVYVLFSLRILYVHKLCYTHLIQIIINYRTRDFFISLELSIVNKPKGSNQQILRLPIICECDLFQFDHSTIYLDHSSHLLDNHSICRGGYRKWPKIVTLLVSLQTHS